MQTSSQNTASRLIKCVLLSIAVCPWWGVAAAAEPVVIEQLKPLYMETSLGKPSAGRASIVAGETCMTSAVKLQQRIEKATGIKLPIVKDTDAVTKLKTLGHIIALGQYGNNKLIEHFYYRWYLVVDGHQPGVGGYVLQTVHNPDALGINLIIVGASDLAGVDKAADRLMAHIKIHGTTLPRLFEVQLGQGKQIVLKRGGEVIDPDRTWPSPGHHPMIVQQAIAEAGLLYLYTAQEEYLTAYKEKLIQWLKVENRPGIFDDFYRILITWDLLEEAAAFSDKERLWITNKLWQAVQFQLPSFETYVFAKKDKSEPRQNHGARCAGTIYFAARYFNQSYKLEPTAKWLNDVKTYWKPQMTSFMPAEGTDQGTATLLPATDYAVAENVEAFLSRDIIGSIADKGLIFSSGGSAMGTTPWMTWNFLAAHVLDDPTYLRPVADNVMAYRLPWRTSRAVGRSFWDGRLPAEKSSNPDWVMSVPVSSLYHENSRTYGPKNVSFDKAFDLLAFTEPSGQGRQYLLVHGQNAGSYSADWANAITQYNSHGYRWLGDPWWIQTTRKLSSVSIVRDGKGTPFPAFAQLERAQSTADWGISRSSMLDYNGTDWSRNIINVPDKWFLIIDEITARQEGDYVLENRWGCLRSAGFDEDDLVAVPFNAKGVKPQFRLTGTGWQSQYVMPWNYRGILETPPHAFPRQADELARMRVQYSTGLARRWAGQLAKDQTHVFANLFYVQMENQPPKYALQKLGEQRYLIRSAQSNWLVEVDQDKQWSLKQVAADDVAKLAPVASLPVTAPGVNLTMKPAWQRTESATILSAAIMSVDGHDRYAVGLEDGRIRMMTETGEDVAKAKMAGSIYALTPIDLDGDGRDELVAGSDTAGVAAFTADGNRLWQWMPPPWKPQSWWRGGYRIRTTIIDILPIDIDQDGKTEILAAGTHYYLLDNSGKTIFIYDKNSGSKAWDAPTAEANFVLAVADVTGDEQPEIIGDIGGIGSAGGSRLVRVWKPKQAKPLWVHSRPSNRYAGSVLKDIAVADFDGDGVNEFVIASDAYRSQLGYYNYKTNPIWYGSAGAGANVVLGEDLDGDGKAEIVVGTDMGQVQSLDDKQNRHFVTDVDQSVTALAARPIKGGRQIWAGTVNGKLFTLNHSGTIIGRGRMNGLINHIIVSNDGKTILVTTVGGHLAVYRPQDHR